ncbi:MAG: hypothetical protein ATN36_01825 [Epulopiscium sp. Nele67-Bin005]|nr:MAG: hypothetical protein ATN36_01825 [Epulopiscium sp. Nele67-Bin005]
MRDYVPIVKVEVRPQRISSREIEYKQFKAHARQLDCIIIANKSEVIYTNNYSMHTILLEELDFANDIDPIITSKKTINLFVVGAEAAATVSRYLCDNHRDLFIPPSRNH